ncbi:MAG: hypothetical protein EAZ42_04585 [Verrucomicrobia bacterium]|nr:MAG: hypothetical protein EAZ42_04585 [Verrucomicrobiota bacterium]
MKRTMHKCAQPASAVMSAACLLSLSSCVGLIADKNTYASLPPAKLAGASVQMQVKPEGTAGGSYALSAMVVSAAVATLDGPFSWRFQATGIDGQHQSMVVHRIRTRTSLSKRDEWYPSQHLGKRADFKPAKDRPGVAIATYPIPGKLRVMPKQDGGLEVTALVTIQQRSGPQRGWIKFRMEPSQKKHNEFIFVPTEIIKSIGQSPDEWQDPLWD